MRVLGIRTLKHGSWFKQNKNIGLVSLFTIFLYQNNTHRQQFPLIFYMYICSVLGFLSLRPRPTTSHNGSTVLYLAVNQCTIRDIKMKPFVSVPSEMYTTSGNKKPSSENKMSRIDCRSSYRAESSSEKNKQCFFFINPLDNFVEKQGHITFIVMTLLCL